MTWIQIIAKLDLYLFNYIIRNVCKIKIKIDDFQD